MADQETTIIVTECRQVHSGTGRNGKEYQIYEVQATRPDRTTIDKKLRSFRKLPLGQPITVTVEKYVSEQYGESFTVTPKGNVPEGGVTERGFSDALQRIVMLEEAVTKLARRVYGDDAGDAEVAQAAAAMTGAQPPPTPPPVDAAPPERTDLVF